MKISKIFLAILFAGFFLAQPNQLAAQSVGKDAALETLGMQAGIVLYNGYVVIGSINDGYVKDAWDKQTVLDLLDEQITMMNTMYDQYDKLLNSKFLSDPSDSSSVVTIMKGTNLVIKEARKLKDYVNDPSDENRDIYMDARAEAWKLIAKFLDIEEDGK